MACADGRAAAYSRALAETPLYGLLKIAIHAPLAHRVCWFCGVMPPHAALGAAQRADYLDCLASDIALAAKALKGHGRVAAVDFNAGGPLTMTATEIGAVLDAIEAELGLTDQAGLSVEFDAMTLPPSDAMRLLDIGFSRFTFTVTRDVLSEADLETLGTAMQKVRSAGGIDVGVASCADIPARSGLEAASLPHKLVRLAPDRIVVHRNADRPCWFSLTGGARPLAPASRPEEAPIRAAGYIEAAAAVFTRGDDLLKRRAVADAGLKKATLGFGAGACANIRGRQFRKARDVVRYCGLVEAGLQPVDVASPEAILGMAADADPL